ncbi:MAG: LptF/LptG family permease, partial [Reichenbachiella sp.]
SLASFDLNDTDESLFADNRYMKGIKALTQSIDSMSSSILDSKFKVYATIASSYKLHLGGYIEPPIELVEKKEYLDSLKELRKQLKLDTIPAILGESKPSELANAKQDTSSELKVSKKSNVKKGKVAALVAANLKPKNSQTERKKKKKLRVDNLLITNDSLIAVVKFKMDSIYKKLGVRDQVLSRAVGNARNVKSTLNSTVLRMKGLKTSLDSHVVEKYKKYAQAFSCIAMFLIGAPLGAIIKRGGLGFPVIISIFFFIIFYVLTSVGDKWAKSGVVDGLYAAWMANVILFPVGIFFLKQARKDAKIFDADFYSVWIENIRGWWQSRRNDKS